MFTGIIEEIGEITRVQQHGDAARLTVRGPLAVEGATHGDSISVSGVCLTVVGLERDEFTADVMRETLEMSTLDRAAIGTHVNLERAARLGDRLGGHLVQGHVDGTAVVLSTRDGSAWRVIRFSLTPELAPLVARKGSIAVDGTSLTVSAVGRATIGGKAAEENTAGRASIGGQAAEENTVGRATIGGKAAEENTVGGDALGGHWFEVSLIPETLAATTLGQLAPGDLVNLETDIVARQVERALELGAVAQWATAATPAPTELRSVGPASADDEVRA